MLDAEDDSGQKLREVLEQEHTYRYPQEKGVAAEQTAALLAESAESIAEYVEVHIEQVRLLALAGDHEMLPSEAA